MDLSMPKNMNELMNARVELVTGTAALATAVLCAYAVMPNTDGGTLLSAAVQNLMSLA